MVGATLEVRALAPNRAIPCKSISKNPLTNSRQFGTCFSFRNLLAMGDGINSHSRKTMYRIIGADGKEYGPISVDQLKQWIAEGRANAQTRVMLEGTTDWKTLAEFPELAALLTAPTPGIAPGAVPSAFPAPNAGDPIQMINGPATGLLVVAILGFCAQLF